MNKIYIQNQRVQILGSVTLLKTDACNNHIVLRGAVFNLMKMNINNRAYEIYSRNHTTDKNGMLTIDGLEIGLYKLIEVKAPRGYKRPQINGIKFEIIQNTDGFYSHEEIVAVNHRLPCCCCCCCNCCNR